MVLYIIHGIKPDFSVSLQSTKFKVLHISSCFPRKGIDILLNAFCETFTDQDEVSLTIKTFNTALEFSKRLRTVYIDAEILFSKSDT